MHSSRNEIYGCRNILPEPRTRTKNFQRSRNGHHHRQSIVPAVWLIRETQARLEYPGRVFGVDTEINENNLYLPILLGVFRRPKMATCHYYLDKYLRF